MNEVLAFIDEVMDALGPDDPIEVADDLGVDVDDLGDPSPVVFAPRGDAWMEGAVLRSGDDGAAIAVRLTPATDAAPVIDDLRRRWPGWTDAPRRPGGGTPQASVEVEYRGRPFLLVVDVDVETGLVESIVVRRNDRL